MSYWTDYGGRLVATVHSAERHREEAAAVRVASRESTTAPLPRSILAIAGLAAALVAGAAHAASVGPLEAAAERKAAWFAQQTDERRGWLAATGKPDADEIAAYPDLLLEGNWHIEWNGHPQFRSARVFALKGLKLQQVCGASGTYQSCRDPSQPLAVQFQSKSAGMVTVSELQSHDFFLEGEAPAGAFAIKHHAFCCIVNSVVRPLGESRDVLVGTWKNAEGESGREIWRRDPPPVISRMECVDGDERNRGSPRRPCGVSVARYPTADTVRGNLPGFRIEVYGDNMRGAGPLPVYLDWHETHLEVDRYCYLYERIEADGRHLCHSSGHPSVDWGEVIGLRITINLYNGASAGRHTLYLGGNPVYFDVALPASAAGQTPSEDVNKTAEGVSDGWTP